MTVERAGVTDDASNARFVGRRRLQVDGLAEETVRALVDVAGVSSFDIIGRVENAAESGALEQSWKKHDADSAARRGPAPKKTSVGGWRRLSRRLKTPLSPISPAKTSRKNTKHS